MLYLIEDRDYLKIGYSKQFEERWKHYETHNCYAKIIASKEGSRVDEKKLHQLCDQWKYKNEWFHNVPEVKQIFNDYSSYNINDYNWIKKHVTDRYIKFLKTGKIDGDGKLRSKVHSLRNLVNENKQLHQFKKWVDCYYEQDNLREVLWYIDGYLQYEPSFYPTYQIFLNTNYDISEIVLKEISKLNERLEWYKYHRERYYEIDAINKTRELTLEEQNEYWRSYWILDEEEGALKYIKDKLNVFENIIKESKTYKK